MNITVFAGRNHHFQKLKNVITHLQHEGHYVTILVADNAINIDPPDIEIYPHLSELELPNFQVKHIRQYVDMSVTFDGLDLEKLSRLIGIVSPFWISYSASEYELTYKGVERYLSHESPDLVLGLHENNFWFTLIAYLCKQNNIPTFVFQEGLLRQIDQESMGKQSSSCKHSSHMFVWSDFDKNKYMEAGIASDKISVIGATHLAHIPSEKVDRVVVALPLLQFYTGDLISDLQVFASIDNVYIRPHPFDRARFVNLPIPVKLDLSNDVEFALRSKVILSQHSSLLVEGFMTGCLVGQFNFGNVSILESKQYFPTLNQDFFKDNSWLAKLENFDYETARETFGNFQINFDILMDKINAYTSNT